MKDIVLGRIRHRTARVAVFGLGRIGLPIATTIAEAGFQVIGVDLNSKIVKAVSKGRVDTTELGLSNLIKQVTKKGLLKATSNGEVPVKESSIIVICVPTPIREDKTPNLSYIEDACETIAHTLNKGKLIIIESTLPPKTTKTFIPPTLKRGSELRCGLDFWLAYCPERLTPGKVLKEFVEDDKIIGGYNTESAEIAAEFFKTFIKGDILTTDATTAEVSKLSENTFRDVNIAFANELALLCEYLGVDVMDVIKLANTHPRVNIHMLGCGVGGPCLPKDPYLLLHSDKGFDSYVIKKARIMNDEMPKHIVDLVLKGLRDLGKRVLNSKITILGTAYKGNVDDPRLSPSKPIIEKLLDLGAKVVTYDPYCSESFKAEKTRSFVEAVTDSDCIIVATDHTEFKDIDFSKLKKSMNDNPIIVDGRRIVDPVKAKKTGFKYYGVGYGVRDEGR